MSFYIGIDVGGTNVKAGVVDEKGVILGEAHRPTGIGRPEREILNDIAQTAKDAVKAAGITQDRLSAVGVGCPGSILPQEGLVAYSNNLHWQNVPLGPHLNQALGLPVLLGNDANVAALGEVTAGCAQGATSAIIITLGTGVGAGIVLNGHIWTGWNSKASEFGHMVIVHGGRPCTCGRKGCLESYASATGLIALTKEAMAAHPATTRRR